MGDVEHLRKDLQNGPSYVFSDHTNCSTSFCKVTAGISNSSSQQVIHSGGVVATQVPAHTSSSAQHSTLTSTIDNIINHKLAKERENYTIEDEARSGDSTVNRSDIPDDLFFKVKCASDRLVSNAPALISNSTSNLAECLMSVRCKFDGGKVYN